MKWLSPWQSYSAKLTQTDTAIQSVIRFPMRGLSGFMIAMYLQGIERMISKAKVDS